MAAEEVTSAAPMPNPAVSELESSVLPDNSLSIRDNRTGKTYCVPVTDGSVRAIDLRQIKTLESDVGLLLYDPSLQNTASCRSQVTYIDGDRGILRYRGYPVEELAEKKSYLEVSYLLIHGNLPSPGELAEWKDQITQHTMVHVNVLKFMDGFHYDAHPMGMMVSTLAALSTLYDEAKQVKDPNVRLRQIVRLIAKTPTIAAFAYRHSVGIPYIYPNNDLDFAANFLSMMFGPSSTAHYDPDPVLADALDTLFVLHADHEQNCSTNVMRSVGSSLADPYVAAAGAAAALYGPLHGGANEQVVRMLQDIGSVEHVPKIIQKVKAGEQLLMGFGHRVYKSYDPRARIIKRVAEAVFSVTGRNPLIDIALSLEAEALSDDYFISRRLYPNVDFYSGIIYQALGFPTQMFPVLFAIPRMSGWLAQWQEMVQDPEQKISRPRQIYVGSEMRHLAGGPEGGLGRRAGEARAHPSLGPHENGTTRLQFPM